ncbi:DUF192 domain-containing protein [Candidatus Pacearchaeota archaeon]|nr:DUF192 domain-containing protein [Candidatus Pacearchaeota archaeon]
MKKDRFLALFILFLLMIIILVTIYIYFNNFKQQTPVQDVQTAENIKQTCFKQANIKINKCFSVEVAQTAVEREKGLMFREKLDSDKGLLFIFPRAEKYGFWMKNTLIALDIIWIDENKTIVYIKENALPCKEEKCDVYYPNKKALYVLEVNGGLSEENNLSVGEIVEFRN